MHTQFWSEDFTVRDCSVDFGISEQVISQLDENEVCCVIFHGYFFTQQNLLHC
jgi:hypothetical protein